MKIKIVIPLCAVVFCLGYAFKNGSVQSEKVRKPRICINNYKTEVQDGTLINCRKIENMGVVLYLNESLFKYDNFQVELHRFGADGDVMVAYQSFIPSNKEFQKKIANKDSLKLDLINPTDLNNSDFLTNTLKFKANKYIIENVVCTMHELQHCNFYVVIKGYYKTGKTDRFGDEIYDDGAEVSERSITFRNWEKK